MRPAEVLREEQLNRGVVAQYEGEGWRRIWGPELRVLFPGTTVTSRCALLERGGQRRVLLMEGGRSLGLIDRRFTNVPKE